MADVFLSEDVRTARKEHPCYWCRERIKTGERYIDNRSIQDGRPVTIRIHMDCDHALGKLSVMDGEAPCENADIDGGGHARGQLCGSCY